MRPTARTNCWSTVLVALVAGCTTPVAGALDDGQANRVVVALDRAGIGADKEPDPAAEGRFRIVVGRDDLARAIGILRDENLPAEASPGVLDAVGKGGLVPSPAAEHAQVVAGIAGDLERTLGRIDGVIDARVHLSLPAGDPLIETRTKPSASVLLRYRTRTAPVDPEAVQRLVAGAAPGLAADRVTVVLLARPLPDPSTPPSLARLGPIWATRGSISVLRTVLATSLVLHLALVGVVLFLWARLRRTAALPAPTSRRHEQP